MCSKSPNWLVHYSCSTLKWSVYEYVTSLNTRGSTYNIKNWRIGICRSEGGMSDPKPNAKYPSSCSTPSPKAPMQTEPILDLASESVGERWKTGSKASEANQIKPLETFAGSESKIKLKFRHFNFFQLQPSFWKLIGIFESDQFLHKTVTYWGLRQAKWAKVNHWQHLDGQNLK